jgi:ATP-binding cassette, subfamily B, bacterial
MLSLGDPTVTREDLEESCRLACIDSVIDSLPMRFETPTSDGGATLSGGKRQRLAPAGALVRKAPVFVLDEATSALDTVTERQIQASLAAAKCTRIVVAHRLSTIVDAHLIIVVDGGSIVERGKHSEPVVKNGLYGKLVHGQSQSGPH